MTILNPDAAIAVYANSAEYKEMMKAETRRIYFHMFAKAISFFVEIFLLCIAFYGIYRDIQNAINHNHQTAKIEQNKCLQDYTDNSCDNPNIPFALQAKCQEWKICSEISPTGIGPTKITVRFIAQLINDLIEPLSAKSVSIIVLFIAGYITIFKR